MTGSSQPESKIDPDASHDPSAGFDHALVVRYSGELALKSKQTRRFFTGRLAHNLVQALKRAEVEHRLEVRRGRFYVHTHAAQRAAEVVAHVFGVQAVALTRPTPWSTLDDVVDQAVALHSERVKGRTFAARVRRFGDRSRYTFDSTSAERAIGSALLDRSAGVDLGQPEITVGVELSPSTAWHHLGAELDGPGGLPLDPAERGLAMVSGGFDSAVASWRIMRRGTTLDFLFFDLAGDAHVRGVIAILDTLYRRWIHGVEPRLHVVDLRPAVALIRERLKSRFWQVALKRTMMRAADLLARSANYPALVTGEALGQVSTQSLRNLAPIGEGLATPVLRPLIGDNKPDIIEASKFIGTHDAAAANPEYCALDAGRVVSRIHPDFLEELMVAVPDDLLETLVAARRSTTLHRMQRLVDTPEVGVTHVPDDADVIDVRDRDAFAQWHLDASLHLPFGTAVEALESLPLDRRYVFVCEVGLKSAFLAQRLRARGGQGHNFVGGIRAARRTEAPTRG